MRTIFLLLPALLLLGPAAAWTESTPAGLNEVVRALEGPFRPGAARGSAIVDFEADFFQESRLASLDRGQQGQGRVAVRFDRRDPQQSPLAKFRWDYQQPTTQQIVSNGSTLWFYLPENRQVIESDFDQAAQRPDDPMVFLTGLGNLSRDFLINWGSPDRDREGNPVIELRPRRPSPLMEKLVVVVGRQAVGDQRQSAMVFPIVSTTVY
ncbi:MAG: outer membrane lipoprotein carrier protein LolA, partial [Desulfuromonadales bacterium]|nr:outer membrane lipoprotein carrier protein LolA [Desulfuromonadales bacterium]